MMTKTVMVRQILLESGDGRELVIWANTTKKFKVGSFVTLKNRPDPETLWEVKEIFGEQELAFIHTDWRVGGL
jgi:hypothetical protein